MPFYQIEKKEYCSRIGYFLLIMSRKTNCLTFFPNLKTEKRTTYDLLIRWFHHESCFQESWIVYLLLLCFLGWFFFAFFNKNKGLFDSQTKIHKQQIWWKKFEIRENKMREISRSLVFVRWSFFRRRNRVWIIF